MDKLNHSPFGVSDRLSLFPDSTRIQNDALFIGGHTLTSLADRYQTPLYLYDRTTMDASVVAYKGALKEYYPAPSEITYAGKAFLCKAIAEWTQEHNLWVDCTGEGEIAIALAGNVAREHLLVHGVNKSPADLKYAFRHAGTIVVDNLTELKNVVTTSVVNRGTEVATTPNIWFRLLPGVSVDTHHTHTQTGQHESKFGMTREEILEAANFCREHHLPLKGIHFHQGSNFRDVSPLIRAIEIGLDLVKDIEFKGE
ncbi:MAG TPA: hypothetical protein VJM08_15705, partial [Anaerolineales bacterium]|nr:hypothetical protein [Anaerolineales bacterium]